MDSTRIWNKIIHKLNKTIYILQIDSLEVENRSVPRGQFNTGRRVQFPESGSIPRAVFNTKRLDTMRKNGLFLCLIISR